MDLVVAYWTAQRKNAAIITESSAGRGWTLALFILTPCSRHCFPAGGSSHVVLEGLQSSIIAKEGPVLLHVCGCSLPRNPVGLAGVPTLTCPSLTPESLPGSPYPWESVSSALSLSLSLSV